MFLPVVTRTMSSVVLGISLTGFTLTLHGQSNEPSRIIGENDLVHVTKDFKPDVSKAVGRMAIGCTATHVGKNLAITAGHCVSERPFEGVHTNQDCSDTKYNITWGVVYDGEEGDFTTTCTKVLSTEYNDERDYAILKVTRAPKSFITPNFKQTVQESDKISIFSHPQKRPMEWSDWCEVNFMFEKSNGNQFGYECDTEGGSSGASVLNESYEVIGIHNFYNGMAHRNGATRLSSTPLKRLLTGRSL